jgi:hypothetical protein
MFEKYNINDFDIKLVIYVIGCILILTWGTYQVFQAFQMLGAVVYFAGALYVCIIYGIRWFKKNASSTTIWPPVINTCPDYLTYYDRQVNGKAEPSCIDTIGVSKKNKISIFPKDGSSTSDERYFFSLVTTTNNKKAELCQRANDAGLTWEGITNGESCVSNATNNSGSSGSSASGTCTN